MSSDAKWNEKGATISAKNAVKEFSILTNEDVEAAIADGRLESRVGNFMGKQYTKLLRDQVQKLAEAGEIGGKTDPNKAKETEAKDSKATKDVKEAENGDAKNKKEAKWTDKGATISEKNAVTEFPVLTPASIAAAIDAGKIEAREGKFMGKSYRKLLRHQVEALARSEADKDDEDDDDGDVTPTEDDGVDGNLEDLDKKSRKRITEIDEELEVLDRKRRRLMLERKKLMGKGEKGKD